MRAPWLLVAMLATVACSSPAPPPPPRACAPPRAYWGPPHNFLRLMPRLNLVGIDRGGAIYWNGDRLDARRFASYLSQSHRLNPEPEVFLEIEAGAPCTAIERVRDEMDRRLECRNGGRCAEGVRSIWEGVADPPGTPPS